jgi:hypothetical protein
MASPPKTKGNSILNKHMRWLLIGIAVLMLVLAGMWFYLSRRGGSGSLEISEEASRQFLLQLSRLQEPVNSSNQILEFSEVELNSFLHYQLNPALKQGIKQISVHLEEQLLTIQSQVNFEEMPLEKGGGKNPLLRLVLRGEHHLEIKASLVSQGGRGSYQILEASLDGGDLPRPLIDLLLSKLMAARIPGVAPDRSIRLPAGIDQIEIHTEKILVHRRPA